MGRTRDLFRKIRDTKGTFHTKMGSIKDRNGMDLTEAEDIKKRWQEYTEEMYKRDHDPENHDDVITHLEPVSGVSASGGARKTGRDSAHPRPQSSLAGRHADLPSNSPTWRMPAAAPPRRSRHPGRENR